MTMRILECVTILAVAVMAGCSSISTVNPRALTVEDVAAMAEAGVGAGVIQRQIEATRSRFELTADDIIRLKRAGVADDVLTAMIGSGEERQGSSAVSVYDSWYDPLSPAYMGPYGSPYVVYRNPGLIGRFYSYYPLSRGSGYWTDPYRDDSEYNNDRNPVHPGTGEPIDPNRDSRTQQERRQ